ncbi:MAG TPA: outer membrane protein assembly factor BamA [Candidatus Babeliales bacterium]|nr:outer membrane protein assembly factor BamA [Candidatus Babeliales bacterium]
MMSARRASVLWLFIILFIGGGNLPFSLAAMQSAPANQDELSDNQNAENESADDYEDEDEITDAVAAPVQVPLADRIIRSITVEGNSSVPSQAILSRIPYHEGQRFDPRKTNTLIKNVNDLNYFKNVQLYGEPVGSHEVDLFIVVQEKMKLAGVEYQGNKHLTLKEIEKKINFSKITSVDEMDLPRYIAIIKKLYRDKDYHNAQVTAQLQPVDGAARVIFTIQENNKTLVKRIFFSGNESVTDKKLRSLIYTREDWILGFMDRAGSYQPDMIEADKQVIENYYQSNGFLNARVISAQVQADAAQEEVMVTYCIQEGDQYTISDISVPGNDLISEEFLKSRLPIKECDLYSKEKIRETIEGLRLLWGDFGYIYADIEPSVKPNEETKTVSIAFYTELGSQVTLDSINIRGNEKTEDKIIRRQLVLQEGGILTTKGMDDSKQRVELLGYFDQRNGVNWKINRLGNDRASLDLMVKEVKTGRAEMNLGFGGSPRDVSSPIESLSLRAALSDTNLFGKGIQFALSGEYAKREVNFNFNLTQPWLFDRPIHAGIDIFTKRTSYSDFFFLEKSSIHENIVGGAFNLGFVSHRAFDSLWINRLIVEDVRYTNTAVDQRSNFINQAQKDELQGIINRRFQSGTFIGYALNITKDIRNHPVHPSNGYQWQVLTKTVFPSRTTHAPDTPLHGFGFFKADFDVSWYTPLIDERSLVFCLHGHLGLIAPFKHRTVPYRELYNIGGPASVRGFEFGEIGPQWVVPGLAGKSNPLGATKAFWINAELIFPISADFSMKGGIFYDGGAGWDTLDAAQISPANLRNNHFSYRHAVGLGLRVLRPTPIKVDWGFKLDRRKGEEATRVHFSAYHEF